MECRPIARTTVRGTTRLVDGARLPDEPTADAEERLGPALLPRDGRGRHQFVLLRFEIEAHRPPAVQQVADEVGIPRHSCRTPEVLDGPH